MKLGTAVRAHLGYCSNCEQGICRHSSSLVFAYEAEVTSSQWFDLDMSTPSCLVYLVGRVSNSMLGLPSWPCEYYKATTLRCTTLSNPPTSLLIILPGRAGLVSHQARHAREAGSALAQQGALRLAYRIAFHLVLNPEKFQRFRTQWLSL